MQTELTHLKRPWCWERLRAGGEGDDRGWDGWMASPTQWTWVWVDSRSWCWTGTPGMLQFMGLQRVRFNWATELNIFQHSGFLNNVIVTGTDVVQSPSCVPQGLFQWVGSLHQMAKILELQLQYQSSNEYSGLISFKIDWFGLLSI